MENNLAETIGELKTDIKWIKETLEQMDKKYAPIWVKYPVYGLSAGVGLWALQRLLALIETVKAFIS